MIRNVQVSYENGVIRLLWEWENSDVDSLRIYYKKKDISDGIGSLFMEEDIVHYPYRKMGSAERMIINERGLYSFIFIPKMQDGSTGESIFVHNIMLGDPICIFYKYIKYRDRTAIIFPDLEEVIPAHVVYIKGHNSMYCLSYELNKDTLLLFPFDYDLEFENLKIKKPYDKLYYFREID